MSNENLDDVFDSAGGGSGAPSYDWPKDGKNPRIGAMITGEVVDLFRTVVKDAQTKEPKLDKNGNEQTQVNITIQTNLRNWESVTNVPKDEEGNELPASEDTGLRRIYCKYRMLQATAQAVRESDQKKGAPKIGGKLAVRVKGLVDVGQLNKLPDYEAKYQPPVADAMGDAFDVPAQGAPAAAAAAAAAPVADTGFGSEPPF